MLDWLLSPIDVTRPHEIGLALSWHARLMVLSWGMLTPVAVLAARFYKIAPGQKWPAELDNRMWWKIHAIGQSVSFVIACVALGLIWISSQNLGLAFLHLVMGYMVMGFGILQVLSGTLRGTKGGPTSPNLDGSLRGDHYDMTPQRLVFEWVHKTVGYVVVCLIILSLQTGLWAANAPLWMWIGISGWWLLLIIIGIWFQRAGRAYDTYQAIWGPDPEHPGNTMAKQGIGVVRPSECPRFKTQKKDG